MLVEFEQLFYGRGECGYGILGESPGAKPFSKRIETLCGAVGTPNAGYGGEPFLLSVQEGEHVIMVCGQRGASDSMGRETLFFHALIAEKKGLVATNADAFTLFDQGLFIATLPDGGIEAVLKEVGEGGTGRVAPCRTSFPCLIRSHQPEPIAVRLLIGNRSNELSWATFSFQHLPNFDVQVLSPRIPVTSRANEYDVSGKLIHSASTAIGLDSTNAQGATGQEAALPRNPPIEVGAITPSVSIQPKQGLQLLLRLSLLLNAALVFGCVVLVLLLNQNRQPPVSASLDSEVAALSNIISRLEKKNHDLVADNVVLKNRIDELENQIKLHEHEKTQDLLDAEYVNKFLQDMPAYFNETQCEEVLSFWEEKRGQEGHLYHQLSEWTEFFIKHPRPERKRGNE